MLQRVFVADLDPERLAACRGAGRRCQRRAGSGEPGACGQGGSAEGGAGWVKVGLVCPYTWDVPGGVQEHIMDLAETLIDLGHQVSVISPADDDTPLPGYVVPAGRAVPVPYNGSVARLAFGFLSASRVRRWLKEGGFDVLHVHEPAAPSLSLLACWVADGPIVATVHTAIPRSRAMHAAEPILQSALEKISGRIAVSEAARTTLVEHFGGDAVLIPNGVPVKKFEKADPLPGWPGPGGALGFLGRMDEPRKGFDDPGAGLRDAGRAAARAAAARRRARRRRRGAGQDARPALRDRIVLLGQVSDADKVRVYHSVDVFCAPNTGGESFGIVLAEAMAAGAPIVASDLDAFRQVLRRGQAGELFPTGDAAELAAAAGPAAGPARSGGPRLSGGGVRGGACLRLADGGQGRGPGLRGRGARGRARVGAAAMIDAIIVVVAVAILRRVRVLARGQAGPAARQARGRAAPHWTRPWCAAARSRWSWRRRACSTRPPACCWPARRTTPGRPAAARNCRRAT